VLGGEIDMAVAPIFAEQVFHALADCPDQSPVVVVDLSAVTFLDSSGLGALVEIRKQAVARGQLVTLRGADDRARGCWKISGIDSVFRVEPSESDTRIESPAS